jgi:hypothetical protein
MYDLTNMGMHDWINLKNSQKVFNMVIPII